MPGCKPAVFVRVAIHREVEKISPYTAIIEERVPFAWRPVAAKSLRPGSCIELRTTEAPALFGEPFRRTLRSFQYPQNRSRARERAMRSPVPKLRERLSRGKDIPATTLHASGFVRHRII